MSKVRRTFHPQIVHVFGLSVIPLSSLLISHLPPFPSPFSPFRGLGGFSSLACSFFARRLGAGFPAPRLSCLALFCVRHLCCRSFVRGVLFPPVFLPRSVSSPFRHPFTSRRCTGELVPFRNMLPPLACSFFAVLSVHFSRIIARALCCSFRLFILGRFRAMPSPALSFFIKKFAYSKYFLYLCTRNKVQIDPK